MSISSLKEVHKKIFGWVLFFGAVFLYYQKINLPEKITQRPCGEHVWAQCDRASIAQTYHMDKAPFLLPRCYRALKPAEGISVGEFPLVPYISSKFYDLFGFNELYFRLIVLITAITGFIISHLITRKFLLHWFASFFVAVIWFASPNLIYYSFSFLPDITGLAFMLAAVFFLVRHKNISYTDLFLFFFFFSAAGLIRISTIIPLSGISAAFFITGYRSRIVDFKKRIIFILIVITALGVAYCWLNYAKRINAHYKTFIFLLEPVPPKNFQQLVEGVKIFIRHHNFYYIKEAYYVLAALSLFSLWFIKRTNWFLFLSTVFCYAGFAVLFYLMFEKSYVHHYYWVTFQIAIFLHILWIGTSLQHLKIKKWFQLTLGAASLVFINFNSIHIHKNIKYRWNIDKEKLSPYYSLENYLEKHGIGYDKRIVSYPDESYNNTLYLINRKGWTIDMDHTALYEEEALSTCDYAVLSDTTVLSNFMWKSHINANIGQYENLWIYSLK